MINESNRRDPYKSRETYFKWKAKIESTKIESLSQTNSDVLKRYIFDMEQGINVGAKKGARSHVRLNASRNKLQLMFAKIEAHYNLSDITTIEETQIHEFFNMMRDGRIKKKNKGTYKSVNDYIRTFKAFWHWWQKVNKKDGTLLPDITEDLDATKHKPKFNYVSEENFKKLTNHASYKYKVLLWFLFDTGIRAPTELLNVKISDFSHDFKELQIREEVSKTFGRKIKLMLCPPMLQDYIQQEKLEHSDFLFTFRPSKTNEYLKRLGVKVLGIVGLTLYDFRHAAACYWLPRYKSEAALKYRFGWTDSKMIGYYTEFLGMKDTISEQDLVLNDELPQIQKDLDKEKQQRELLQQGYDQLQARMKAMEERMMQLATQHQQPITIPTPVGTDVYSATGTNLNGVFRPRKEPHEQ